MSILDSFISEYHEKFSHKKEVFDNSFLGHIKQIKVNLLSEKFYPSLQLKRLLNRLIEKAGYPMEVAIVGQFSSGKSTFLNALLSKKILPTGITPVTSKINFINYGSEYKLKISYYSGVEEYASIDSISTFTDQRKKEMDNIKYLTLYAPMEILKDITFVDTPGLNSQSHSDTKTTKKVLKDVGGIIWLTLIDNAGKMSEIEILEEYMDQFANKSLCVLNQKDKFNNEQIETTTKYIEEKFKKYFSQVTPISAKMALESRSHHKDVLINDEIENFIAKIQIKLKNNDVSSIKYLEKQFNLYNNNIKIIKENDNTNNNKMLEESNIGTVLDFIENKIRPQATHLKEYVIKKDLQNICDTLIKEYETIVGVYQSLNDVINKNEKNILDKFDNLNKEYSIKLTILYNSLTKIIEIISFEIYKNIKENKALRYEENKSIFKSKTYEQSSYDMYWIDSDNINKNLFYDDQKIDKMFKRTMKEFKNIENGSKNAYNDIYNDIKQKIHNWQEPYELIKKHQEIASDIEFSTVRNFAAKVYENVSKEYHQAILENISALQKKFAYFNGAISYSYIQITSATVAHFEKQILESVELYEKEPTKFTIYHPKENEILMKLKANFGFEKIEDFLTSKRNYLFKIIKFSKEQYLDINENQTKFIETKKNEYKNKIYDLITIKNNI